MARLTEINNSTKRLQGQDRFIKNTPDTKPILKLWRSPGDMTRPAKAFHKGIGNILVKAKVLTELDKFQWFELCYLYGQLVELRKIIRDEGFVLKGEKKTTRHPAATIQKEVFSHFLKLSEKFGLTPADRAKIDLPVDDNPVDPAREFLFGKK